MDTVVIRNDGASGSFSATWEVVSDSLKSSYLKSEPCVVENMLVDPVVSRPSSTNDIEVNFPKGTEVNLRFRPSSGWQFAKFTCTSGGVSILDEDPQRSFTVNERFFSIDIVCVLEVSSTAPVSSPGGAVSRTVSFTVRPKATAATGSTLRAP